MADLDGEPRRLEKSSLTARIPKTLEIDKCPPGLTLLLFIGIRQVLGILISRLEICIGRLLKFYSNAGAGLQRYSSHPCCIALLGGSVDLSVAS